MEHGQFDAEIKAEIKVRGKRIDNGKWVYGFYVYDKLYDSCLIYVNEKTGGDGHINPKYELKTYVVDFETVGQYIRLKDKNGVEIYEGDIVRFIDMFGNEELRIVEWDDYEFTFSGASLEYLNRDSMEVIGNIYENPELLEV